MHLDFCDNVRKILNILQVLIPFFSLLITPPPPPSLFKGLYNKKGIENIFLSLKGALVISIKKRATLRFSWIILQSQSVF